MADRIQIRRDTAANWTSVNPTLAQGELGTETDTDKFKVGDGVAAWNSLDYLIDASDDVTLIGTQTLTNKTISGANNTITNVSLNTAVTGTLPVANGGTGASTASAALTNLGAYPTTNPDGYTTNTGTVTSVGGTGTVNGITLSGTVTTSGDLTLGGALTGVNLASQVTGTLPVANGGTGSTSLTANNVLLGNGTSSPLTVAPSTSGNVLTSNGTTWTSEPASGGGSLLGQTDSASPFETSLGYEAGNVNTGVNNTFIGYKTGSLNTTGSNNTANGQAALMFNTTGSDNTATGRAALQNNTTGVRNTATGQAALLSNTTGNNNTANGFQALFSNTTGSDNTANGRNALRANTTGSSNTANGFQALRFNTTGVSNTATGQDALLSNTTGINNIGIGLNAGRSTSPRTITTASNEICLGNNDHTGAFIKISFTVTSDARDKAALAPIPHGLDFVNALLPTEYQFKAGGRDGAPDGKRRYGFLAQDVLAAEGDNPVIINNDDPESLKMTSDYLIPVLVNAMKELTEQVNTLKAEVATLKGN